MFDARRSVSFIGKCVFEPNIGLQVFRGKWEAALQQTVWTGISESDLGSLERCKQYQPTPWKELTKGRPFREIRGLTCGSAVRHPIPSKFLEGIANGANIVTHRRTKLRLQSDKACHRKSLDFLKVCENAVRHCLPFSNLNIVSNGCT